MLIGGDLCDFAFFSEGVEREGQVRFEVLEEIAVGAKVLPGQ